jgi:hypothetical protein
VEARQNKTKKQNKTKEKTPKVIKEEEKRQREGNGI